MTSEKKLRQELEETKNELKKLQNQAKTWKKKTTEDEVNPPLFNIFSIFQSSLFRVKQK